MKNIHTILEGIGITVPEEKKGDFDTAFRENYITVSERDKIKARGDNYKSQLETAQTALNELEGVDVKELQDKITQLTSDLQGRENAYLRQIADMEFNSKVESVLSKAGARNSKAVRALLDLETLRESKNQDSDLQAAIDSCKEENGYLFGVDEPFNNPVYRTDIDIGNKDPLAPVRAAMGLKNERK